MAKTAMVQLKGIKSLVGLIESTIEEDIQLTGLDLIAQLAKSPRNSINLLL